MPIDTTPSKASWADEVGDELDQYQPSSSTDENGVKTIIEYKVENGKKIKCVTKIKKTLITDHVNKDVAARKKWAKFGAEKGSKPGPDMKTTTVGEQVFLKPTSGLNEPEITDEEKLKKTLSTKQIRCRTCKGDHYSYQCPYKDSLPPMVEALESKPSTTPAPESKAAAPTTDGKYIAPHLRGGKGSEPSGGSSYRDKERDDSATIRVTNLSQDVREADVQDLFKGFGSLARVFVSRDRDTNLCKGYAFVSYHNVDDAAKALAAINGYGYDNLILHVEWAQARTQ